MRTVALMEQLLGFKWKDIEAVASLDHNRDIDQKPVTWNLTPEKRTYLTESISTSKLKWLQVVHTTDKLPHRMKSIQPSREKSV